MRQLYILLSLLLIGKIYGQEQLNLLGTWADSSLVASTAHNNTYNEIWGIVVNNVEYAVIGSTYGTHFIDVTDPENVMEVQRVAGAAQGTPIVHRDYHDHNGFLYAVCDEGASTLQIMDITNLPDTVTMIYESSNLIQRSHNIFIDTANDMLYTMATRGSQIGGGAIGLIDIQDPYDPQFIGYYQEFGDIRAGHVHDGFFKDNIGFLNCGNSGFAIVDFSDPQAPVTLSTLTPAEYPDAGYNHSGWLSDDGTHYYMADENHGFDLKTIDVQNLRQIEVIGTFNAGSADAGSIAHNPLVACDYLYVAYYYDGLQIYDVSDPSNPVRTHYFPTSKISNDGRYKGAWGTYPFLPSGNILVSDMQEGLFVFEAIDPGCYDSKHGGTTTSIEVADEKLVISPNPSTEFITFDWPEESIDFEILAMDGTSIERGRTQTGANTLSTSEWKSGVYILRVGKRFGRISKQ